MFCFCLSCCLSDFLEVWSLKLNLFRLVSLLPLISSQMKNFRKATMTTDITTNRKHNYPRRSLQEALPQICYLVLCDFSTSKELYALHEFIWLSVLAKWQKGIYSRIFPVLSLTNQKVFFFFFNCCFGTTSGSAQGSFLACWFGVPPDSAPEIIERLSLGLLLHAKYAH